MKSKAQNHPTGLSAAAATVIVWIATQAGLDVTPEVAAAFVGVIAGVVSYFSPRVT